MAQLTRQRALDLNALTLLVGQPLAGELALESLSGGRGLASGQMLQDLPTGLPSDLLIIRRADVRQAEQQLITTTVSIGAARAAFFP